MTALALTEFSLGTLTQNTAMTNVTLEATGGTSPYVFAIATEAPSLTGVLGQVTQSAGALPRGLSLNAETGVISGTPVTPGAYAFTVSVMDADENVAFQSVSGEIAADTTSGFNSTNDEVGVVPDTATNNLVTVTVNAGHQLSRDVSGFNRTYVEGDALKVPAYEAFYLKNDGVVS